MSKPDLSLVREFEASLAWWRAAGVDCDFTDDATAWLADAPLEAIAKKGAGSAEASTSAPAHSQTGETSSPRTAPAPAAPPPSVLRNLLGDSPPEDLAAFQKWWIESPDLDTARLNPRIPPRGERGAALMVLVPQPEERDRERLLEGPHGRLLANILAAMGLDDTAIYLGSALPCHTPMADLAAIGAGGMDAVLAHHIALAAPQRLLVLGTGLAAMLGGAHSNSDDEPLREINYTGGKVPVMVSETLDAMMDMPRLKARFWRRWMEWSASQ